LPSPISVIVAFGLAPQHVRIALRCRTLNQSASCPLVLTIRAARWRFGVTFRAPRELVVASVAHANADCHRTPLLRFRSLQRNPTATRCSRQPAPNDPASAFLTGSRPARPRTYRNSGVAHAVFRFANVLAVVPGVRTFASRVRRVAAAAKRGSHRRSIVRVGVDRRNRIQRAHDDPHIKRHRNTFAVRSWSCTKRVSLRGVPLPRRTFAIWLDEGSFPLAIIQRRSWDFHPSQV
jgi:hypothetical protein